MLEILISSTVLILALAVMRMALRGKISPRLQYALWLLAALRLLLPVTLVESPVSVMNAVPDVPAAVERLRAPENRRAPQTDAGEAQTQMPVQADAAPQQEDSPIPVMTVLKAVWLAGAALLALVMLLQNLRFIRQLRRVRQPFVCPESRLRVWLVSGLPSPCLAGLFRPAIYLTPEAAADPDTCRFVIRHELAHYRAADQLWSLVRLVCLCIYWFDPFVWLAAGLCRRDCELACDARVLRGLDGGSRAAYGRALLGLITPKRMRAQLLSGATTMQLGPKSLKERIALIARKPRMAAYTLVLVLALSLALAACTFTGAPAQPEPAPQQPEPAVQETELLAEKIRQAEAQPAQEAPQPVENDPEAEFQMLFPELDFASLQGYLEAHPEALDGGWEKLHINEAGLDDAGTEIFTQQGGQVLAIDAEYGILLVRAAGEGYRGVLAICRYPELLRMEMAVNYLSAETDISKGEQAGSIASRSGGILAMSGSGYFSPGGDWDNDAVASWCMSRGQAYFKHNGADSFWRRIELSENGLNCRIVPASEQVGEGTYNAAEFAPALIVDGEACDVTYWTGEQPRACFGEGNGTIYMLVIEGHYPENGIYGTGLDTCTEILLSYGCRNALNMNGGSSAIMWYDGEYVIQSSSRPRRDTGGWPLPNAWVYG